MCGPQRGAIAGAILFEGWADDLDAAEKLADSGEVALEPCHEHGAVGPMAGIISPSMPVWVVENTAAGNRAYSNLNEGLGKVLRFGANSPDVLDRLRWLGGDFFATMQVAVRGLADADLKPLMAQALHMGDELHNRNAAASGLLFKRLTLSLLNADLPSNAVRRALEFVAGNDHFFLNISMAAAKSMTDAAADVPGSSMVTVMARNGVNFGIKLSGTGGRWFQAPANPVDGLYFPGYSVDDAAADLGDSAITETNGLGGFAMAASPAIVQFVGGTPADATANSRRMLSITLGANPAFTLPPLNFGGTPRPESTPGWWSIRVCCQSSTPASRTGRPASDRSGGQVSPPPRWSASARRWRRWRQRLMGPHEHRDRRIRRQRLGHRCRPRLDSSAVRHGCPHSRPADRHGGAGLETRCLPWQRAAGGVHSAPFGTRPGRSRSGSGGLRRRRHPGCDRLHVRQGFA